ncbi:MAG TPA: hypothetical protein VFC78_16940 [Tepidisphaeraceae bacterium]|nr:hypothetical protein [Tepidisphaeraceae bacterium]
MKRISWMAALLLSCAAISLPRPAFAAPPATQAGAGASFSAQVNERLKQLAGSKQEAGLAEFWFINGPAAVMPPLRKAAAAAPAGSPQAPRLGWLLKTLEPLTKTRATAEKRRQDDYQWNIKTALAAYDQFGTKNPKWDAAARFAIRQFCSIHLDERAKAYDTLQILTDDLKCNDPLIVYMDARAIEMHPPIQLGPMVQTLEAACDFFDKSQYPAERKCRAMAHLTKVVMRTTAESINPQQKALDKRFADRAMELWPQAITAKGMTATFALDMAYEVAAAQVHFGVDRAIVVNAMLPDFQKAFPSSPTPLVFKGSEFIDYAWDARGGGTINTVGANAFKLMQDRLIVARETLEKAYTMDPSDAEAATLMITYEMGAQGTIPEMDKWFHRAIEADPTHWHQYHGQDAYDRKKLYLQPKWYGSVAQLLAFGLECAGTGNSRDNVSWILVQIHQDLSHESADPDGYWRLPGVWQELDLVVEPFMRAYPDVARNETMYTYWAAKCGQWKLADEHFKALGDRADPAIFGGQPALEAARTKAEQKAHPGSL